MKNPQQRSKWLNFTMISNKSRRRQRQILGMANTCQHHDHYSQGSRPRKKREKGRFKKLYNIPNSSSLINSTHQEDTIENK